MNRYLIPVLLVLLSLAIYQLYIVPVYAELHVLYQKETDLRAALAEADSADQSLAAIAEKYASLPPDAERKLSQLVPEKSDPTRLLIETTEFLSRNGFSAKGLSVSYDGSEGSEPYKTHMTTYTIAASYETFQQFLHILESSLALRDLASVSFSASPTKEGESAANLDNAIHEYSLRISSYSLH